MDQLGIRLLRINDDMKTFAVCATGGTSSITPARNSQLERKSLSIAIFRVEYLPKVSRLSSSLAGGNFMIGETNKNNVLEVWCFRLKRELANTSQRKQCSDTYSNQHSVIYTQ
jgi:hypothetical protein